MDKEIIIIRTPRVQEDDTMIIESLKRSILKIVKRQQENERTNYPNE